MIAVIDTNVMIAGLLTKRATSPVAKILNGMQRGHFTYMLSPDLIAEYHRALRYPKVARLHQFNESQLDDFLEDLVANAVIREPEPVEISISDPGDVFLFGLLKAADGAILVTGDETLRKQMPAWATALSPAAFATMSGDEI